MGQPQKRMVLALVMGIGMMVLMAACNGSEEATPAGTDTPVPAVTNASAVSPTPVPPTATPFDISTLPPTWTPRPAGFQQEVLPTATRAAEAARTLPPSVTPPTALPPTWTVVPTSAPLSGGSHNPGSMTRTPFPPTFTPIPIEDICFLFTPQEELNLPGTSINQGDSDTIYWNPLPVDGYRYLVRLYHPDGTVVVQEVVDGDEYTFSADSLVTAGYVYGWEVTPVQEGAPVCFPITGEIYVNPVFED